MRKVKDAGSALMNAREMRLVLASAPRNVMELSRRELMGMVKRARGMVDRYEQLAHRLRREAIGRRVPSRRHMADGTMNIRRKAALFRTALSRFEMRLGRMAKAPVRKARHTLRKRPVARKVMRSTTHAMPVRKKKTLAKRTARPAAYARRGAVKRRVPKARRIPAMKPRRAVKGRSTRMRRAVTR